MYDIFVTHKNIKHTGEKQQQVAVVQTAFPYHLETQYSNIILISIDD